MVNAHFVNLLSVIVPNKSQDEGASDSFIEWN